MSVTSVQRFDRPLLMEETNGRFRTEFPRTIGQSDNRATYAGKGDTLVTSFFFLVLKTFERIPHLGENKALC